MDDRLVILDTREHRVFHEFDPVATFLWDSLDKTDNFDALVRQMTDHFDIDQENAERDLKLFLEELKSKRLIA